ncbi:MAG: hypothetical protein IPM11_01350 [Micropruina sp.]|nr:hypothetical protein [Micropruina sp.]
MIDPNGCAAIRVRNTVWQQPDRWLYVDTIERGRKIDALIAPPPAAIPQESTA